MLPNAACFDYRSMFKEGVKENAFDKHINQKLLNILVKITTANVFVDRNKALFIMVWCMVIRGRAWDKIGHVIVNTRSR